MCSVLQERESPKLEAQWNTCACRTLYPWFKAVVTFCLYGVSLLRNCDNIQLAHICSTGNLLEFTFRMHILPSSTRCFLRLSKRKRKDKLNGILQLVLTWWFGLVVWKSGNWWFCKLRKNKKYQTLQTMKSLKIKKTNLKQQWLLPD